MRLVLIGSGLKQLKSWCLLQLRQVFALYALLIILFTFFYTFVQINPEKAAENLQKSGAYIHGVRPGKGTEEYMSKLLRRLATVGSIFLGVISILPIVAKDLFGLSEVCRFWGNKFANHYLYRY